MQRKLSLYFADSAGALLLAVALALAIGVHDSTARVLPPDPIFQFSLRITYWLSAAMSFGVALFCLFGRRTELKLWLNLWLVANVLVYVLGLSWSGDYANGSAYGSSLAAAFGLEPESVVWTARAIWLYLLVGSLTCLFGIRTQSGTGSMADALAETHFKNTCPACGGHIEFSFQNLGRVIPCPHCQAAVTLRKVENLKMSCFFCKGHLEFPAYALGTKMRCPHCNKDITLIEPK